MKATPTAIPDVLLVESSVHSDARGFFWENFNQRDFNNVTGTNYSFVQDNHSRSKKGVLRGLHYQIGQAQGKLLRVVRGSVFDVAVDIRPASITFGNWIGVVMNEHEPRQLWVPPGFAHGFLVMSDAALLQYKCSEFYSVKDEGVIRWNDPAIGIHWPAKEPFLSPKDAVAPLLCEIDPRRLFD